MNNNKTKVCREKLATYKCIEPMDLTIKAINRLNKIKADRQINDADIDELIADLNHIAKFIIDNCYGVKTLCQRLNERLKV